MDCIKANFKRIRMSKSLIGMATAVYSDNAAWVRRLIEDKLANPNEPLIIGGVPPLTVAIERCSYDTACELLEGGADATTVHGPYKSYFESMACRENLQFSKLLVKHGANVLNTGEAIEMAVDGDQFHVADYLSMERNVKMTCLIKHSKAFVRLPNELIGMLLKTLYGAPY